MGYPMSYQRVLLRNNLSRDTWPNPDDDPYVRGVDADDPRQVLPQGTWGLAGDLRRLEADTRDAAHLSRFAQEAGITEYQVKIVLDCFFEGGLHRIK